MNNAKPDQEQGMAAISAMKWLVAFACLSGATATTVPSAFARTLRSNYPAVGGSGDAQGRIDCGPGEFIVGFGGRAGAWIDQISLICAPLLPSGATGPSKAGKVVGGSGGGPSQASCPAGVVRNIRYTLIENNGKVLRIRFQCSDAKSAGPLENGRERAFGGAASSSGLIANTCPGGQAGTGLNVHWGRHVNAVGLICGRVRLQRR